MNYEAPSECKPLPQQITHTDVSGYPTLGFAIVDFSPLPGNSGISLGTKFH